MEATNFSLNSVELGKFGGLVVDYSVATDDGVESFKITTARLIHPDLQVLFDALKERVAWLLGFKEVPVPEDDAPEMLTVIGVKFHDNGDVVFTAWVRGPEGAYKVKTPKAMMPEEYGNILVELGNEVRLYLDGKGAQLSIFGEDYTPDDLIAGAEAEMAEE